MPRHAPCIALALVLTVPIRAQTSRSDPTDVQAWYGGSLRLDLPSRWRASADYRLRMVDNAREVRGSYYTLGLTRKVADPLTLVSSYRLARVQDGTFHRYALGAEAEGERGSTKVALRAMVQYQKQTFTDNDETSSDEDTFLRTRLEVTHALGTRLDVYASTEPYFIQGDDHVLDNWRNTLGLEVELAKGRKVDVFYIYRPDYAKATYNRTFHIVGIDLEWTLKVRGGKRE